MTNTPRRRFHRTKSKERESNSLFLPLTRATETTNLVINEKILLLVSPLVRAYYKGWKETVFRDRLPSTFLDSCCEYTVECTYTVSLMYGCVPLKAISFYRATVWNENYEIIVSFVNNTKRYRVSLPIPYVSFDRLLQRDNTPEPVGTSIFFDKNLSIYFRSVFITSDCYSYREKRGEKRK